MKPLGKKQIIIPRAEHKLPSGCSQKTGDSLFTGKFWLVWRPTSGKPKVKHDSKESASKEAQRLAELNPNEFFYVLESVAVKFKTQSA